eukprot:351491-Chlamydomonas_euryale.AAC.37
MEQHTYLWVPAWVEDGGNLFLVPRDGLQSASLSIERIKNEDGHARTGQTASMAVQIGPRTLCVQFQPICCQICN